MVISDRWLPIVTGVRRHRIVPELRAEFTMGSLGYRARHLGHTGGTDRDRDINRYA